MWPLIKKEFIVKKRILLVSALTYALVLYLVTDNQIPLFFTLILGMLTIFNTIGAYEKNDSLRLIQSFPVSRSQVVLSSTLFHVLLTLALTLVAIVLNAIIPSLQANTMREVLVVWGLALVLVTLYQFLYLWLGPKIMMLVVFVLFVAGVTFGWTIVNQPWVVEAVRMIQSGNAWIVYLLATTLSLGLSALFVYLSIHIYQKQDL